LTTSVRVKANQPMVGDQDQSDACVAIFR
jgi:hypothetical protein